MYDTSNDEPMTTAPSIHCDINKPTSQQAAPGDDHSLSKAVVATAAERNDNNAPGTANLLPPDNATTDVASQIPIKPVEPAPPQAEQAKPSNEMMASKSASLSRVPQRKLSVFSYNGFPNLQLLDLQARQEAHLKQRRMSDGVERGSCLPPTGNTAQVHRALSAEPAAAAAAAAAAANQTAPSTSQTAASSQPKARRSVRSDTLGSTGSSRASSCDEPTIVALGSKANSTPIQHNLSMANQQTLNTVSSKSTSSSSLDTIEDWSDNSQQQVAQNKQEPTDKNGRQSSREPQASHQELKSRPFESIRSKLKQNSMPNAKAISSHIDNLISQNEAIIDNWNLVNIRSYNLTRDVSSMSAATAAVKRLSCVLSSSSNQPNEASQSGDKASPTGKPGIQSKPPTFINELPPTAALPQRRQAVKRASTSSMPTGVELEFATAAAARTISSFQAAAAAASSSSSSSSDSRPRPVEFGRLGYHRLPQDPNQLESAIQNLSLKRKEEEVQQLRQQFLIHHQRQQQQQGESAPSFNMEQNGISGFNQEHHPCSQNLIWNLQQQRDEQILMASLLMDRYRQSVAELELDNQAALLRQQHQQQMIEQMDPYRLLSLDQQPPGHHHDTMALLASLSQSLKPSTGYLNETIMQPIPSMQNLEHGGELLTQSLDSARPSYNCQACDVSFWTKDVLNYHMMTQCAARTGQPPARPMAFKFAGYNNFDAQNPSTSLPSKTTSKSVSPPRLQSVSEEAAAAAAHLAGDSAPWNKLQVAQEREPQWSILKNQLLTLQSMGSGCTTSLPFKKRKISEPNMKY